MRGQPERTANGSETLNEAQLGARMALCETRHREHGLNQSLFVIEGIGVGEGCQLARFAQCQNEVEVLLRVLFGPAE